MVRFFDHWLKGDRQRRDGRARRSSAFRREWAEPEPFPAAWPGEWLARGDAGRRPISGERVLHLAPGELPLVGRLWRTRPAAAEPAVERFRHRPTIGTRAGLSWGAGGPPNGARPRPPPGRGARPDLHVRRRSTPTLDVLGVPAVVLAGSRRSPVATAVVRLEDVAPDGTPFQVSAGILNLTHRTSHDDAGAARAGRGRRRSGSALRRDGPSVPAGHRIRLSVASSMWPVVWPSPYPAEYAAPSRRRPGDGRPADPADAAGRTRPAQPCRRSRRRPPASARSARTAAIRRPGR